MWTINYRDLYIHGYCDREQCRVNFKNAHIVGEPLGRGEYKSLHAAKMACTKFLKMVMTDTEFKRRYGKK